MNQPEKNFVYTEVAPKSNAHGYVTFKVLGIPKKVAKDRNIITSYLIREDITPAITNGDYDMTALEVAKYLLELYDSRALFASSLRNLISYLEEVEEEQAELRRSYEVRYALHMYDYWRNKLSELHVGHELTEGQLFFNKKTGTLYKLTKVPFSEDRWELANRIQGYINAPAEKMREILADDYVLAFEE
jgi:hypothetical protein